MKICILTNFLTISNKNMFDFDLSNYSCWVLFLGAFITENYKI